MNDSIVYVGSLTDKEFSHFAQLPFWKDSVECGETIAEENEVRGCVFIYAVNLPSSERNKLAKYLAYFHAGYIAGQER